MKNSNQYPIIQNVVKASITTVMEKGFYLNFDLASLFNRGILLLAMLLLLSVFNIANAQVTIVDRPQAVDSKTGLMQLDGLFDVSLGEQRICVFLKNNGLTPITNVTATASFSGSSGIVLTDNIESFGTLNPGVAVMGFFTANFSGSHPDKHLLTLNLQGTSFSQTVSRNLFVLKSVAIDSTSWKSFVPEGSITTKILDDYYGGTTASLGLPKDFTWTIDYKIPYQGQFGPIPYNDPWWKVVGAIVGVAGGLTYVAGGIVKYCGNEKAGELVKDIGTGVGGSGGIVAAADSIDVFRRGQQNTMPPPNEFTLREEVEMHVTYSPNAGIGVPNYSALVTWNYKRFTNSNIYQYSVTETVLNNIHYTTSRNTTVNSNTFNTNSTVILTASATGFQNLQNNTAYFVANIFPGNQSKLNQLVRSVVMRDDGHGGDAVPNDGIYTGVTGAMGLLTNQPMGIYIEGYDMNNAPDSIDPLTAAMEIGGMLISTSPLGSCSISADHMIMVSSPVMVNASAINSSCSGSNNGSAVVTATGGIPPYSYQWSNGQTTASITGLSAGTYFVTVTSANGQKGVSFVTVNEPAALNLIADVTQPYCSLNGMGTISLTVSGSSSPVNYLWNDGSTLGTRTDLLPGTYTVTATNLNGACSSQSFSLNATTSQSLISCPADITAGTEPGKDYALVSYNVNVVQGCTGFVSVSTNPASGSAFHKGVTVVTCTGTYASGFVSTCTFNVIVNDNEAPVANSKDLTVSLTANGTKVITPEMINDSSYDNISILSQIVDPNLMSCSNIGTNSVSFTVTDGNNFYWVIDSNGVKYYNNNNILISTHTTLGKVSVIICSDGGFIVIDDGRVRKYDNSGNLQSTIFTTGAVNVILTGDGGFIVIDDGRVRKYDKNGNLQSTIFTTGAVQVIKTPCDRGFLVVDDGRVRKYDKDGNLQSTIFTTGAVKIVLTQPCGFIVIDDGRVRKYDDNGNLQSTIFTTGEVQVITTADGGFIVIDDGRVRKYDKNGNLQSTIFTNGTVQVIKTPCDGGFIVVDDGRVRKYDKDGNLQSTIFTTGAVKIVLTEPCGFIVIDDGRVRKYDGNGNLQSTIFTNGDVKVITTTDGGFIVIDDGRVRLYDSNGNLKSTIFTTGEVTVITMGDCGFIVIDDGRVRKYDKDGNLQSTIFTIGNVKVIPTDNCGFIVIDDGRVRKYDGNGNLQSTIFTTGEVKVITTTDGGFIVIDDGRVRKYDKDGNLQSTIFTTGAVRIITDPSGGFKVIDDGRIRLYDKNGYLVTTIFTTGASHYYINNANSAVANSLVTVLNPINVTGVVTPINCSGLKSGKITLTVTGITGPYTYLWSNGKTSKNLSGIGAGTYTVIISDAHGCNNSASFVVSQPAPIVISISKVNVKCGGKSTGKATATVSGGVAPYQYQWNTTPVQTNAVATGLPAGIYTVTVTDANGCTKTKSVTITENPPLVIVIQQSFDHATAVPSGGVPPYTYKWNTVPAQTNSTATGLICGNTYKVTVTDSKGCTKSQTFILTCPRLGATSDDSAFGIHAFPNPTRGNLTIELVNWNADEYELELTDAIGKKCT